MTVNLSYASGLVTPSVSNSVTCNIIGENGNPQCPAEPSNTNIATSSTDKATGNPINALTGNKFESATDIEAIGGRYALRLNRYYNSRSAQRGLFGMGWCSDYEMQLQDNGDKIDILQADGRKISFTKTADKLDNSSLLIIRYKADKVELGYLERAPKTDISKAAWIWHLPSDKALEFIAHKHTSLTNSDGHYRFGQLSRVTENTNIPNSAYWSLTYDVKGNIAQVKNHLGDSLKFSYQTTKYNLPKIIITKSNRHNSGSQV